MALTDSVVLDFANIDLNRLAELGVRLHPNLGATPMETDRPKDNSCEEFVDLSWTVLDLMCKLNLIYGVDPATEVYIRNEKALSVDACLGDYCLASTGLARIRFQLCVVTEGNKKTQRVNILSVFPVHVQTSPESPTDCSDPVVKADESFDEDDIRWIVDKDFTRTLRFSGVPDKPASWSEEHVKRWIAWAVDKFALDFVNLNEWEMSGRELMFMSKEDFDQRVHSDIDDSFWIHFQLLRTTNAVTVPTYDPPKESDIVLTVNKRALEAAWPSDETDFMKPKENKLWQYLLELLTDPVMIPYIQWTDDEGGFKLIQPNEVAKLWGFKIGKHQMNYEKLARGLRYYYGGDLIAKVPNSMHTYRFTCDLQTLTGFSPKDLRLRVTRASRTSFVVKPPERIPCFANIL